MSYSIKNKVIETVLNVGRTSLLEILSSYSKEYRNQIEEGFLIDTNHLNGNPKQFYENKSNIKKIKMMNNVPNNNPRGIFQVSISLNKVFSFFRDTNNVIKGFKHEFLFTLNSSLPVLKSSHLINLQNNNYQGAAQDGKFKIRIMDSYLKMFYVNPNLITNMYLTDIIASNKKIKFGYYPKTTLEISLTQGLTKIPIDLGKYASNNKIRRIVFSFQRNKIDIDKNDDQDRQTINRAIFDHLDLSHYQIKLMNQSYPSDKTFELDFSGNRYVEAYDEYVNYFNTYNYLDSGISKPLVSYVDYKNLYPIFCIDCSNQDTSKDKHSTVDAFLNLKFSEPIPANSIAYVIVYYEQELELQMDGTYLSLI